MRRGKREEGGRKREGKRERGKRESMVKGENGFESNYSQGIKAPM